MRSFWSTVESRRVIFAAAMMLCGSTASLPAQQTKNFDQMLSNLGYEVTQGKDGDSYFTAGGLIINATFLGSEGVEMLFLTHSVPPGAGPRLRYGDMLIANGNMASIFLVTGSPSAPRNIGLVRKFPLAGLTPVILRSHVEGLLSDAQTYEALWNVDKAR